MTAIPDVIIEPRFSETDALGHINNVAISSWIEFGRTRLLAALAQASMDGSWFVHALAANGRQSIIQVLQ